MYIVLLNKIYTFQIGLNQITGLRDFLLNTERYKMVFINSVKSNHPNLLYLLARIKYGKKLNEMIDQFLKELNIDDNVTIEEIEQMKICCKQAGLSFDDSIEEINKGYAAYARTMREWHQNRLISSPIVTTEQDNKDQLRRVYESFK